MIARIAYLTSPQPGVYMLNVQPEGSDGCLQYEISRAHLANILVDGTALALRETSIHRVSETQQKGGVISHERAERRHV